MFPFFVDLQFVAGKAIYGGMAEGLAIAGQSACLLHGILIWDASFPSHPVKHWLLVLQFSADVPVLSAPSPSQSQSASGMPCLPYAAAICQGLHCPLQNLC